MVFSGQRRKMVKAFEMEFVVAFRNETLPGSGSPRE
jgi:hypothetical protein